VSVFLFLFKDSFTNYNATRIASVRRVIEKEQQIRETMTHPGVLEATIQEGW